MAPLQPGGIAPTPVNLGPALALTPAQVTTLASGNITTINQLLGSLVPNNTSNQALATLVNTLVTPPPPALPPTISLPPSLPPVASPPPSAPPIVSLPPAPPAPPPPVSLPPPVYETPQAKASPS
jgi:hypothetical protein